MQCTHTITHTRGNSLEIITAICPHTSYDTHKLGPRSNSIQFIDVGHLVTHHVSTTRARVQETECLRVEQFLNFMIIYGIMYSDPQ